jgi:hypothetical protein
VAESEADEGGGSVIDASGVIHTVGRKDSVLAQLGGYISSVQGTSVACGTKVYLSDGDDSGMEIPIRCGRYEKNKGGGESVQSRATKKQQRITAVIEAQQRVQTLT